MARQQREGGGRGRRRDAARRGEVSIRIAKILALKGERSGEAGPAIALWGQEELQDL
jgi:hypothetical protein